MSDEEKARLTPGALSRTMTPQMARYYVAQRTNDNAQKLVTVLKIYGEEHSAVGFERASGLSRRDLSIEPLSANEPAYTTGNSVFKIGNEYIRVTPSKVETGLKAERSKVVRGVLGGKSGGRYSYTPSANYKSFSPFDRQSTMDLIDRIQRIGRR